MSKIIDKNENEKKELAKKIAELALARYGFIPQRKILVTLADEIGHHYQPSSLRATVLPWIAKQGYK